MNELHHADLNSGVSPHGDVILLCDPTKEGDAIGQALMKVGFSVPTADLPIIEVRMLQETPLLIVVDIDQPAAVETIERMRELPDGAATPLICVGNKSHADELRAGYSRCFPRPVDVAELIAHIKTIADPTRKPQNTQPSIAPPPLSTRAPDTVPPPTRDSEAPAPSARGEGDPFDIASILPSASAVMSSGGALSMQLSPELEQLMIAAERRVGTNVRSTTMPPPEAEELTLAPEQLAALNEPLEMDDDEAPGTGPTLTTRSRARAQQRAKRGGAHGPPSTGSQGTGESTRDSAPGTPVETDPMQPSRGAMSVRSYRIGPTSAGPHSRRWRPVDEDTATEGPVSRDSVTPVERRGPPSARSIEAKQAASGAPKPTEPLKAAPSMEARNAQMSARTIRDEPKQPARPSREEPAPVHTQQNRPFAQESRGPLSIAPGSMYSTRSAALRSRADTTRPTSTTGSSIPEGIRHPPATAASPAPMASPPRGPSRRPPPYVEMEAPYAAPKQPAIPAPPPLPRRSPPPPSPDRAASPELAPVVGEGDAALVIAQVIAGRASGSLAITSDEIVRRILLQDGDIMIAASTDPDESLLAFLALRGDIDRDVAARFENKLPPFGRHAGAALIAHGHLGQDDLWPVLRAHAEWIIGRAVLVRSGACELEVEPPLRLKAEPNVFGGATGAEVLIETVRRVVPPDTAARRVGGRGARVNAGPRAQLLGECALRREEEDLVRTAQGRPVSELLEATDPDFVTVLYALACLGVIELYAAPARLKSEAPSQGPDSLDDEAVRQRVRARLALVEDGDYFSLLGVARSATSYEVKRAYLDLRRTFEPARLLTASTADLLSDVRLVIDVLDEAYDILRDPRRRERYRKAIESPGPP